MLAKEKEKRPFRKDLLEYRFVMFTNQSPLNLSEIGDESPCSTFHLYVVAS
jgi:hypothetical protein